MEFLTKDDILSAKDLPHEVVEVPEWGGKVRVRGLTGEERSKFEKQTLRRVGPKGDKVEVDMENFRAKLCALTMVDENGVRVFSDAEVVRLGTKSALALQRVFEVAQRLSGLAEDEVDKAEEDLEQTPSDASISS